MIGIFSNNIARKAAIIIGLISGVLLLLLMSSLLLFMQNKDLDDIVGSLFFCIFGCAEALVCGLLLHRDRRAFLQANECRIQGFCQIGGALDCQIQDIKDISFHPNGMHIVLRSGKRYILHNLQNGVQVQDYIYRRLPTEEAPPLDKEKTIAQLAWLNKRQKPEIAIAICSVILVIPCIILTAWLTDWKELHEFVRQDWLIFGAMGIILVLLFAVFAILLRLAIRHSDQYRALSCSLYQQVLRATSPGPGNLLRMYVDDERYASGRICVYGFPNADDVYFTVEDVDIGYEIRHQYTSEIYPDMQSLMEALEDDLIEIPIP